MISRSIWRSLPLVSPRWIALQRGIFDLSTQHLVRNSVVVLLAFIILLVIYRATGLGLSKVEEFSHVAFLSPAIPFSIIFTFLLIMLTVSNVAAVLGVFFVSEDNEIALSSPRSDFNIFVNRSIVTVLNTSWMPFLFLLPMFLAFGVRYDAGIEFYLILCCMLLVFFSIPLFIAIIIATVILVVMPHNKARLVKILGLLVTLAGFFICAHLIRVATSKENDMSELLGILKLLSLSDYNFLPSQWLAYGLRNILLHDGSGYLPELALLLVSCLGLGATAFIVNTLLFNTAWSRVGAHLINTHPIAQGERITGRNYKQLAPLLTIARKDWRLLCRDVSQILQLGLLAVLFLTYLYNLRLFQFVNDLQGQERETWRYLLFVMNSSIASFLTIALASRFIFPSLSLEGRSFWILQSSPLSIDEIITFKFSFWVIPTALISSTALCLGAYSTSASLLSVAIMAISGVLMASSVVSVAIFCGSVFSNFRWEHSSQLIASFGSFIFMALSVLSVALSMFPLGIMLEILGAEPITPSRIDQAVLISCGMFILLFNIVVTKRALFFAGKKLTEKVESE